MVSVIKRNLRHWRCYFPTRSAILVVFYGIERIDNNSIGILACFGCLHSKLIRFSAHRMN